MSSVRQSDEQSKRELVMGRPDLTLCDNRVSTAKYTLLTFLPISIREQFRRNANIYFLAMGILMAVGYYSNVFQTAISPWTTLGPLAVVMCLSLAQEGFADLARHRSDNRTNQHPCVIISRGEDVSSSGGQRDTKIFDGEDLTIRLKSKHLPISPSTPERSSAGAGTSAAGEPSAVQVACERVKRMDIRAGQIVLVRNRDMVPADLILLASSGDSGNSYIETSSIDGETNLKLRSSPSIPRTEHDLESSRNMIGGGDGTDPERVLETLEQAVKRVTRMSALARPDGQSALLNPVNPAQTEGEDISASACADEAGGGWGTRNNSGLVKRASSAFLGVAGSARRRATKTLVGSAGCDASDEDHPGYVTALTSEPPNASVNTYSGKLTMPPFGEGLPGATIALGAENILLRGAILRNTEWAIGMACFTGKDTKLVMNSFQTPSKFSGLDEAINRTVILILFVMLVVVILFAGLSVNAYGANYDYLWYVGYNEKGAKWPYFPDSIAAPNWDQQTPYYIQQVFLFITLLNNFVPLSLYVTVEVCTLFMMFCIGWDRDMYHEETDTPALARSTTVTDLGQVKYIFSDKTGTLTQNVMRFKRCSVDGMAFGAPVEKSAPGARDANGPAQEGNGAANATDDDAGVSPQAFHPLRQLLLGAVDVSNVNGTANLGEGDALDDGYATAKKRLTFNAEMFLRVMSICHTVVVEKDFDANVEKDDSESVSSKSGIFSGAKRKLRSGQMKKKEQKLDTVSEAGELKISNHLTSPSSIASRPYNHEASSLLTEDEKGPEGGGGVTVIGGKSNDGAPIGHNYQAESPDEGALVSAASLTYGFQFTGRDSIGVRLAISSPSLLADEDIANGLKDRRLTLRALSAQTASPVLTSGGESKAGATAGSRISSDAVLDELRLETWEVLAVNKFDSDRKRMSVLVRSPPELGSILMLLCKGADSSMLDGNVCSSRKHLMATEEGPFENEQGRDKPQASFLTSVSEDLSASGHELVLLREREVLSRQREEDEWEMSAMLGIQAHLGDFASEGLRTLVLGIRILGEDECDSWLKSYKDAASSIKNRDKKMTEVALAIERDLHIVGATAIEDKLQDGVPETIATLGEAGIKLWVLTGDKRETAIEIGYSTKVLTPKMHLTQVADGPVQLVKTLMAMEFVRLVKCGKLPDYQHAILESSPGLVLSPLKWKKALEQCWRSSTRFKLGIRMWWFRFRNFLCCRGHDAHSEQKMKEIMETMKKDPAVRRKAVRDLADQIIKEYLASQQGEVERTRKRIGEDEKTFVNEDRKQVEDLGDDDEDGEGNLSLSSDTLPDVFNRAESARAALDSQRYSGNLAGSTMRNLSIATVTSRESTATNIVDEDMLSLASFVPDGGVGFEDFDKKKRTILEKLFAVDRHVRHGHLGKHLTDDKLAQLADGEKAERRESILAEDIKNRGSQVLRDAGLHGPRALVIEGAALVHLLGDPENEELLFAVASACDAVIACRVSPKQKALLVRLVRKYVSPTPVTLAIGDGANDVGMIQEAHVGVGVSGLEGQQAVNASDFAIAQFRFLRDLLLIHGRWNFIRLSKVALFSFYKNALMAGTMLVFQRNCLYSATPLYDQWVISSLNFVAGWPILFTGLFDRDLEKDYVRRNPIVYASGPNNENMTLRITLRWIFLCFVHLLTIYWLSAPAISGGAGVTSAFAGLMSNNDPDVPGDGEGGDMKVFGTTIYTSLILTLAYKVFFETKSIINGEWPAFTCRKGVGEGWPSRLAYTWIGIWWLSVGFFFFFAYTYSLIGREGASSFSQFVFVAMHVYNARAITWMSVILVPVAACVLDVTGKLFSNLYYPTQSQIHTEIQSKEIAAERKRPAVFSRGRGKQDDLNQVESA